MMKSRRNMEYMIFWSDESLKDLDNILSFLESEWTVNEVIKFKSKLLTSDAFHILGKTEMYITVY